MKFPFALLFFILSPILVLGQTNLITSNSNFYNGSSSGWSLSGDVSVYNSVYSKCYSCPGYAGLGVNGGYAKDKAYGTISRSFTIPSNVKNNSSATLYFYLYITTAETNNTKAYDTMHVILFNSSGQGYVTSTPYSNINYSSGYIQRSLTFNNIHKFAGQTMTLMFEEGSDGLKPSTFRIDDVSFLVNLDQCSYDLSDNSDDFNNTGGSGSFNVITQSGCSWSATTNQSWIDISKNSGSGSGKVSYSVNTNQNASSRTGYIDVEGENFVVHQDGKSCTYQLSSSSKSLSSSESYSGSFDVYTSSGCSWSANSSEPTWLHSTSSNTGNGTVNYTVDANSTSSDRNGEIIIEGEEFVIFQPRKNDPGKPDLQISSLTISPLDPELGEMVNATFYVLNVGTANANNVSITLYLSDGCSNNTSEDHHLKTHTKVDISAVNSKFVSISFKLPNDKSWIGNKQIKCWVDFVESIDETKENNNKECVDIRLIQGTTKFLELNRNGKSHLLWPFYVIGSTNPKTKYEGQDKSKEENNGQIDTDWYYSNDHEYNSQGEPTHHTGSNFYAQDWNYLPNGGNNQSDCGLEVFAPVRGKIIYSSYDKQNCRGKCSYSNCNRESCGNFLILQVDKENYTDFFYKICHLDTINAPTIRTNAIIKEGTLLGRIGGTGATNPHLHFVLYKNIPSNEWYPGSSLFLNGNHKENLNYASDVVFDAEKDSGGDGNLSANNYNKISAPVLTPNPNNGTFSLNFNGIQLGNMKIKIYDMFGRLVYENDISLESNLVKTDLPSGLYTTYIQGNDFIINTKLLITK